MILINDYNALALVGTWNKGIFNHEWISRFLLPKEKKLKVEIPLNLNIDVSPRVSSDNVRIVVIGNKLNFVPLNTYDDTFELIQELAIKTADYLPHTPVTAFGINFLFETDFDDYLKELLKLNDTEKFVNFGASIKSALHTNSIEIKGRLINVSVKTDNSKVSFDFNFHFEIQNLSEFKEKIASNRMLELKEMALHIMKEVYNLQLNE